MNLLSLYKILHGKYGPQRWWPIFGSGNPQFEIAVGAILTQNTAWTNVEKAIAALDKAKLLHPEKMRKITARRLAKLIRSSGYYNQKAEKLILFSKFLAAERGFSGLSRLSIPELRARLLGIWGIGKETADSIILYAFHKPIFVVDAYTRRFLGGFGVRFKTYDEYRNFFESRLPKNVKLWQEYHALIVRHGKEKSLTSVRPKAPGRPFAQKQKVLQE